MESTNEFNQKKFESEVLKQIESFIALDKTDYLDKALTLLVALEEIEIPPLAAIITPKIRIFRNIQDARKDKKAKKTREFAETTQEVEKAIQQRDMRKYLCPALLSVSNDSFTIAKTIIPILVPLILAGTIALPLNPVLFASISLLIARMGIASLCYDFEEKKAKDE